METILAGVGLVALTLWVGGMFGVFLSTPVLFRRLESREQAGAIAGEIIERAQRLGGPTGAVALLAAALRFGGAGRSGPALTLRALPVALILAAIALSMANRMLVQERMREIKEAIGGPIDGLSREHPLRVRYNRAHGLSMLLFAAAFALALIAIPILALG
ncbi:MAG: DUF4149 domain-containing protein [Firmicutes bacterium]|nr:DUF4149 domain-containing protein [Bacillota bacterium]